MIKIFKPPTFIELELPMDEYIFLAGSIEMGKAEDWQTKVSNHFMNIDTECKIGFINPRRDNWDSSWEQTITNPNFFGQVEWEHHYLSFANNIFMYFDPDTKSPISLLELGLFGDKNKLVVVCPKGFWRKGNVDFICNKYKIPEFETLEDGIEYLKNILWLW